VDRNEVVLVGRLSGAAEEKKLPSGDILTKWRLVVRRRGRQRRGGTLTDTIPCVTFDPEAAALVGGLKPGALLEVTGAFRCRIFGPSSAKIWRYEVEVLTARAVDADPPHPAPADASGRAEPLVLVSASSATGTSTAVEFPDAARPSMAAGVPDGTGRFEFTALSGAEGRSSSTRSSKGAASSELPCGAGAAGSPQFTDPSVARAPAKAASLSGVADHARLKDVATAPNTPEIKDHPLRRTPRPLRLVTRVA
jgi:single-strand DNA-binding protein